MKKLLFVLVPLALFAQVQIDTVIRFPTDLGDGFFIPELNKLYVKGRDQYYVLDCPSYQLKAQIPGNVALSHCSWNWRRQKLYISGLNGPYDSTLVVDASADSVIGWLTEPYAMQTDAYLSDVDRLYKPAAETLFAFDCAGDTVVKRIPFPVPGHGTSTVSWDSADSKLYVGGGSKLAVYDYVADSFTKVIDVSSVPAWQPDAMVFNYPHHRGYLGPRQVEMGAGNVGIIDTELDTLLSVLPVRIWSGFYTQVAMDERDGKVYLADFDTQIPTPDTMWVVDCATDSVLGRFQYEHRGNLEQCVRWVPWSNRIYLVSEYPDSIHKSSLVVIDCNTDSVIVSGMLLNSAFIQDIELDPVHERIFVTGVDTNYVYVLRDVGYGVEETPKAEVRTAASIPTIIRGLLFLPANSEGRVAKGELLNASGRKVLDLHPGANDVRALAPGVYFVREAQAQAQAQAVRKVVVTE